MRKSEVVKWGNSLAVRIPKMLAEEARLKEGDPILLKATNGRIELQRAEKTPTLHDLVAQITPDNRYEETDWGSEVGREKIEW